MTTEDDWQTAMDEEPGNFYLRLVFADWLEERDDPREFGYRALGALGLWTMRSEIGDPDYGWEWWFLPPCDDAEHCILPAKWFKAMVGGRLYETREEVWSRDYSSRREADDAAARAFATLAPDEQAELLAGTTTAAGAER